MKQRYEKNASSFSAQEQELILTQHVCVIGCGGLGGYVISQLSRFGVRKMTIVDGDVFAASNLNRQLFCNEQNLSKSKVQVTAKAVAKINSEVIVKTYFQRFTSDNASAILSSCDVVFDCLDNISSRLLLEQQCALHNKVLIHGAIAGLYGQVSTIFPHDNILSSFYHENGQTIERNMGNPPFTPGFVASLQTFEGLKVLAGRTNLLRRKLLFVDLEHYDMDIIEMDVK